MILTTVTSRDLIQNFARARKAAKSGPEFNTDRGIPVHSQLSLTDYHRLEGDGQGGTRRFRRLHHNLILLIF